VTRRSPERMNNSEKRKGGGANAGTSGRGGKGRDERHQESLNAQQKRGWNNAVHNQVVRRFFLGVMNQRVKQKC